MRYMNKSITASDFTGEWIISVLMKKYYWLNFDDKSDLTHVLYITGKLWTEKILFLSFDQYFVQNVRQV